MCLDDSQDLPNLVRLGLARSAFLEIYERQVGARRVPVDTVRTAFAIEHVSKAKQNPTQVAKPDIRRTVPRALNQLPPSRQGFE
jgi:hypothetical protein